MKFVSKFALLTALLAMLGGLGLFYNAQDSQAQGNGQSLRAVWLVVRTGNVEDGGTDDNIQLRVQQRRIAGFPVIQMPVTNFSWDENERNRTETYTWALDRGPHQNADLRDIDFNDVCIETLGSNAWFIQSIWIMGETTNGDVVLLAANPYFNAWMSRDSGEGESARNMRGGQCLEII